MIKEDKHLLGAGRYEFHGVCQKAKEKEEKEEKEGPLDNECLLAKVLLHWQSCDLAAGTFWIWQ